MNHTPSSQRKQLHPKEIAILYTNADIYEYHTLFDAAEHEISIFTGKSDMEYADEFIKAACNFSIRSGCSLKIACQCGEEMSQCHIIKAIIDAPERQGEIIIYSAEDFRGEPYFILADKAAYRVEIPALAETIQNYDDQEETLRLHEQFQHITSLSSLTAYLPPILRTNQ